MNAALSHCIHEAARRLHARAGTGPRQTKAAPMADRKRSQDGSRDTDRFLGARGTVSQGGRTDGRPARQIATRDERKRAFERPAGATRVTGSDKDEDEDTK